MLVYGTVLASGGRKKVLIYGMCGKPWRAEKKIYRRVAMLPKAALPHLQSGGEPGSPPLSSELFSTQWQRQTPFSDRGSGGRISNIYIPANNFFFGKYFNPGLLRLTMSCLPTSQKSQTAQC